MTMANEKGSSISSEKIMKMLEEKMKELDLSWTEMNEIMKKLEKKEKKGRGE